MHPPTCSIGRLARDERGMVTVEAAYALGAIAVFLVIGIGAVAGVSAQIRCTDAAREVARLTAAGDESARSAGRQVAPTGADIAIGSEGDRVVVTVSTTVPLLPMVTISARAVAVREPEAGSG
ncbi:TadE family type IV pilus minor pilin [Gordonia shandongensis]|uniref:TadE family type IV pilus minor pilin n=1 Tax=Gordonia shandongensis TaxID=376351 RepID=UPI0004787E68|nr:TadE family type IV pilus minor pilin [Gordonia shandongensis]